MKNVLDKFNQIVEKMNKVNKSIADHNFSNTTGYGPRFHKIFHQIGKRIQSIGIYDYHTKKYVLFDMINMVGSKNLPKEFNQMEKMLSDARPVA